MNALQSFGFSIIIVFFLFAICCYFFFHHFFLFRTECHASEVHWEDGEN